MLAAFSCIWFVSCISMHPAISGTPTPTATPTPPPGTFNPVITGEPSPTDMNGYVIDSENHYFDYLSFGDMRVYEYGTGTFLDGICINSYPVALDGEIQITFYADDGRLAGFGKIHTANGGTELKSGTNPIYSEINTDISLLSRDFVLEIIRPYQPVLPDAPEQ